MGKPHVVAEGTLAMMMKEEERRAALLLTDHMATQVLTGPIILANERLAA